MEVADLSGAELDYWAGKANGDDVFLHGTVAGTAACSVRDSTQWTGSRNYSPSTNWSQGGPIIEREKMQLCPEHESTGGWSAWHPSWSCDKEVYGKTPLIAAMRCYVASKFGEEVDDSQADHI